MRPVQKSFANGITPLMLKILIEIITEYDALCARNMIKLCANSDEHMFVSKRPEKNEMIYIVFAPGHSFLTRRKF